MIVGALLIPVIIIAFIIALIKGLKKKFILILIAIAIVTLVLGIIMMPEDSDEELPDSSPTAGNIDDSPAYSNTEIFAAKFCMAYMNHLKNPYSFKIKSIWAYDKGDGNYEVYVKYTAENSLGGEVAEEIGTMSTLNESELTKLANDASYLDVYTWGSEPVDKTLGKGTTLSPTKIQEYINANYK